MSRVGAPFSGITERLTLISAVIVCCGLASLPPKKWHLLGWTLIAGVFFGFLYQDTGIINHMEVQVRKLVWALPPYQRIIASIQPAPDSRVEINHIVDRACIGHCFSYGNYEPATGQFRVRARPGNSYVMTEYDDISSMEHGSYIVQPRDGEVYEVYQCSKQWTELRIKPLRAGEKTGRRVKPSDGPLAAEP